MAHRRQKILWILFFLCHVTYCSETNQDEKEVLVEAEAKDALEIIKTIKKVNDDGSYTIGYEADDGSFKIESRDVLGNIKGTYGYVDDDGEIKRVSYSTTNTSELVTDAASVVQRIPSRSNRTYSTATKRPTILLHNPTTTTPPTSTSNIQTIPRRRTTTTTTTTTTSAPTVEKNDRSNFGEYENAARSTTIRPNFIYETATPKNILLHTRPLVRSTIASHLDAQKSEGQIVRPEIITGRPNPTELPLYRRLALRNPLLENDAFIRTTTIEPEIRGNLLRRQLNQEKIQPFDAREHILSIQQGLGADSTDVYSASVTTGSPRQLFTTTARPRILSTPAPILVERVTPRYQVVTAREQPRPLDFVTESTTETPVTESPTYSTTRPVPVIQIPPQITTPTANQNNPQEVVAIPHPFHRGYVFVPLSHLRAQQQQLNPPRYIVSPNGQFIQDTNPTPTPHPEASQNPAPIFIQRPPVLRSIPVHVDEKGIIRELPQQVVTPTPVPIPIPVPFASNNIPVHKNVVSEEVQNEIDQIRPPVSTRDFQRLLEHLVVRQRRLERANALIHAQRQQHFYQHSYPYAAQGPLLIRRTPNIISENGPVTFIPQPQAIDNVAQMQAIQPQRYFVRNGQQQELVVQEAASDSFTPTPQSYIPTRRVARLFDPKPAPPEQEVKDNYLPPSIREMLLLKMLQLAMNPALPVDYDEQGSAMEASSPIEQTTKKGTVRNVEILGEESADLRKTTRSKRYKESEPDYYYNQLL